MTKSTTREGWLLRVQSKRCSRCFALLRVQSKRALTRFWLTKTSGWYLNTRCWTQRVSIGCEPTLLALSQHRLTFLSCIALVSIWPLLTFGLLSLRTSLYFLQPLTAQCTRFKNTRFLLIRTRLCVWPWPRYLWFGIPFDSSNWQTDVF